VDRGEEATGGAVELQLSKRSASSALMVEKPLSITALSWQLPRRLMLHTIPRAARRS